MQRRDDIIREKKMDKATEVFKLQPDEGFWFDGIFSDMLYEYNDEPDFIFEKYRDVFCNIDIACDFDGSECEKCSACSIPEYFFVAKATKLKLTVDDIIDLIESRNEVDLSLAESKKEAFDKMEKSIDEFLDSLNMFVYKPDYTRKIKIR